MKTAHKIFLFPMLFATLTVFGIEAVSFSMSNPSPAAYIGARPAAFMSFDRKPLFD